MLKSSGGSISTKTINNTNTTTNKKGFPCSPPSRSSSSSTCSSPSPRKSIEEVWNDINLPSLVQQQQQQHNNNNNNHPLITPQEFLALSFNSNSNKDPTTTAAPTAPTCLDPFDFLAGTLTPLTPLPLHPPATILSEKSPGSDHHLISSSCSRAQLLQSHFSLGSSSLSYDFDTFGSSSAFPSSCKKRGPEKGEESGDRRHKRMMKNRESAARSRARKQAYTNELEHEVKRLKEENAKLKKQQKRFLAAAGQLPKKHPLCRTLTAPF